MKKTLATIAALMVTMATYGQGTIIFSTRVGTDVDAPVARPDGTGAGAGFTAQLFIVNGTSLTAVTPTTPFRTASPAASFYNVDPGAFAIANTTGGQTVTLRMYAFNGSAYNSADTTIVGNSNDISVTLGGGGSPPGVPAELIGLKGFTMHNTVPEPSTIALGVLGLGALLIRRKK